MCVQVYSAHTELGFIDEDRLYALISKLYQWFAASLACIQSQPLRLLRGLSVYIAGPHFDHASSRNHIYRFLESRRRVSVLWRRCWFYSSSERTGDQPWHPSSAAQVRHHTHFPVYVWWSPYNPFDLRNSGSSRVPFSSLEYWIKAPEDAAPDSEQCAPSSHIHLEPHGY